MVQRKVFFSYSRDDSEFVLKLAKELREAGANIWLDQLDIEAGDLWDIEIEKALKACDCLIAVLSPTSVASRNVMDEVSYALEKGKDVIPVICQMCEIPFRMARLQYIDLQTDYATGFQQLLSNLEAMETAPDDNAATQETTSTALASEEPPSPAPARRQVPGRRGRGSTWMIAGGGVVAVAVAVILVYKLFFGPSFVPKVAGMSLSNAEATLTEAGLVVKERKRQPSNSKTADLVIDTDPAAGDRVERGDEIVLILPTEKVMVPSLVGLSPEEAARTLDEKGLSAGDTREEASAMTSIEVLRTEPEMGASVERGARVTLVVPSAEVSIPSVVGRTEDDAKSEISRAGLVAAAEDGLNYDSAARVGAVFRTEPGPETRVKRGSSVTLHITRRGGWADLPTSGISGARVGRYYQIRNAAFVRKGAGTNFARVGRPLERGECVKILNLPGERWAELMIVEPSYCSR